MAKVFAPDQAMAIVLDAPEATSRAFICVQCYCSKQISLGELAELTHSTTKSDGS
jgi:hypothetical protein